MGKSQVIGIRQQLHSRFKYSSQELEKSYISLGDRSASCFGFVTDGRSAAA